MEHDKIELYQKVFFKAKLMVVIGIGVKDSNRPIKLVEFKEYTTFMKTQRINSLYHAFPEECLPADNKTCEVLYGE